MDSLYILNYETISKCDQCNNKYNCYDDNLLKCINRSNIYKYCPFMKLIHNNIKVSIYENNKISNINDYFYILEYLLQWAHKSEYYKSDIKLRIIIIISITGA